MDFGAPHETEITKLYDKPVFVYGYPSAVKAFYMEPWPDRPEVCKSVDLLAPEGYGEICGGSERMSDPDKLAGAHPKEKVCPRKPSSGIWNFASMALSPTHGLRHGHRTRHRLDVRH
jgi:aspartyl/asparaginyl-tRNA synthetase